MAGLISAPLPDSPTLRALGTELLPSSSGDVADAVVRTGLEHAGETWGAVGTGLERAGESFSAWPGMHEAEPPPSETLTAQGANQLYGIPGRLQWQQPVAEDLARDLYEAKRRELLRADVLARGPGGVLAAVMRGGLSVATGLLDPLNVAAGFVPVIGPARYAAMLANAGGIAARTGIRAAVGAAEGAVGMGLLTPVEALRAHYHQDDYGMADAISDIAFGTAFGGGLHVLGGVLGDALHSANPITRQIEAAGPEARQALLSAGVAQLADDTPVNVAPLLDLAGMQSGFAARQAARGETSAGNYAVYTPSGLRIEARPEVVELADLIASHDTAGMVNPDYPHAEGMQPRDRASAASQDQVNQIASRLEPELLGPSPMASAGAPIVRGDNVVESGNGRVMILRKVYSEPQFADQAAAYRAFLAARGHDVEGMTAPVLIGRRMSELTPEQARELALSANERTTLGMSAAEQARADVGRAAAAIDRLQPGEITSRQNAAFVAAFMAHVSAEERANMVLKNGQLSGEGARRIQGALLGYAYGDALGPVLERMLNGDVAHMKALAGALSDVAGLWGQLRAAIARGEVPKGLDLTDAIGEAAQLLDQARRTNTPLPALLAQGDMIGGPSPAAAGLLRLLFHDEAMTRPVGREKLANLLSAYTEEAMKARPGPDLFGAPETTAADILRAIGGQDARMQAAADALVQRAQPEADTTPEQQAGSDMAHAAAQRATESGPPPPRPSAPAEVSAAVQAAQRAAEEVLSRVQTELAAGRLTEADLAPLRNAKAALEEAEGEARAHEAAAACMIARGAA